MWVPLAAVAAVLAAGFGPLAEDFEAGRVSDAWKINLGSKGSFARFEQRDGGKCLHLFGDHAGAVMVTREPVPDIAYTLEYDFFQPGDEAKGYQAVVQHQRPGGYAYWWLEYGPGRFFLYTYAGGVWYNRWQAQGVPADRWYRIRVRNTPTSVRVWIFDETGKKLLRQSGAIPHDRGEPGPLVFSATGTEKGSWGMKIDNVKLVVTPIAERDDYRHRAAAVEAARKAVAAEGVRKLWRQAAEALKGAEQAIEALGKVDPEDWDAYVKACAVVDDKLRDYAEQYHSRVVARMGKRRGGWVMVDLWGYFDTEAAFLGIAVPAGAPVVEVRGVPFAAVPFGRNCLWQDEGSRSERAVKLGAMAKRVALLLAPKYNGALYGHDDSLVDVLQVELRYEDGRRERVVPVPVGWRPRGPGAVGRPPYSNGQADAFEVVPGHAAKISEVVLCDGAIQAGWALLGLSYQPGTPDELPVMKAARVAFPQPARRAAKLRRSGDEVVIENPSLRLGLSTRRGEITRLESPYFGRALGGQRRSPYFAVQVSDRLIYSDEFRVVDVQTAKASGGVSVTVRLRGPDKIAALEVRVTVVVGDGGETKWRVTMLNRGERPVRARLISPMLDGLDLGPEPTWYFPQRGGAASDLPIEGLSSYGGMAWLQIVDAAGRRGGVYLRCDDTTGVYKIFALRSVRLAANEDEKPLRVADIPKPAHPVKPWRTETGVHMSVQYLPRTLNPGGSCSPPAATVAAHPGDWREALRDYRRWLATWWKPRRGCPDRYRYGFYALVGGAPRDNQRGEQFGSYDWWHLGGIWSIDYPDELKPQIEEWRKQAKRAAAWGQAIGLYIEGMVMEKRRRIAREHGAEWAMMDDEGHYYTYYSRPSNPVWNMCPAVKAWQKWDAWAYSELAKRVPLCAMYVDSLGSRWAEVCYNPAHHHDTPGIWPRGCAELFEAIRQAVMKVSPEIAIHSEEPGCDYMALHEDGSWSHSLWTHLSGDPEYNPAGLNYFRFVLPEFKMYEIPSYRQALWRCKLAFFNGEGLWTNIPDELRRELFTRWMPTLRENAETFLSADVEPAVRAVAPPLYMNRFSRGEKSIYTLYNAGLRTVRAEVVVPLPSNGHVFDLLKLREMTFETGKDGAVLRLAVDPHEVTCFVVCPRVLDVRRQGARLQISLRGSVSGASLVLSAVDARGARVRTVRRAVAPGGFNVDIAGLLAGTSASGLVVRVCEEHDTIDIACIRSG